MAREPLPTWTRDRFVATEGRPLLFYVVFGTFPQPLPPLSRSKYCCEGPPAGFDMWHYSSEQHPDVLDSFREGYVWEELRRTDPGTADRVLAAAECLVLKGAVGDQPDLNYLRDAVGFVAFLLDHGGAAVNDVQALDWYSAERWQDEVFLSGEAALQKQVVLLSSEEDGGTVWLHTRGLRKFGRPDVSIRGVTPERLENMAALCNRLISYLIHGGGLTEGQPVRLGELAISGVCRPNGDLDDPDFNNVHVEIVLDGAGQ